MNSAQLCTLVEKGIENFSELVHADESEQKFQSFFEENIIIFQALGYLNAIPHPVIESRAKGRYIPDFIVQRHDGLWQVLELKRPNTKVLKNSARRDAWYAEMQGYLSQCIDYIDQLRDQSVCAMFERRYGVTMHQGFPATIIAGKSEYIDQLKITRMLDRFKANLSLATFDQALVSMQAWYSGKYPQAEHWSGFTVALLYQLEPFNNENGCVFDVGWEKGRNRISLRRKSEEVLELRIIDNNGLSMSHDFTSPDRAVGRSVPLMISAFPVNDILRIVLEADGLQIVDIRSSIMDVDLPMPSPTTLGNDFEESGSACFVYGMFMARTPTLSMSEREKLRGYIRENFYNHRGGGGKAIRGMRFSPSQFMYSEGHPYFDPDQKLSTNMVQRNDDCRPTPCG